MVVVCNRFCVKKQGLVRWETPIASLCLGNLHRDAAICIIRWSDRIAEWQFWYLGIHTLASRYESSKFSVEDIIVFLRRMSGPEKAVGLPEVRQLGRHRVWHSLTGRLAHFSLCFLQQPHTANQLGERNKETLVFQKY